MKIVLSRKGFDQGSGGGPSPILPDGTMISLPIPDGRLGRRYGDLKHAQYDIGELVRQMSGYRYGPGSFAHLDPDLEHSRVSRADGWLPAFGQTGAAQGHLAKMGVGPGDLFLFFGWFADVENRSGGVWRRKPGGRSVHAIHGWMQVGEVISLASGTVEDWRHRPWLAGHPHVGRYPDPRNTVYIARQELSLTGVDGQGMAGGGHFHEIDDRLIMSAPNAPGKSVWQMPEFFAPRDGRSLSYHGDPARWSREGGKLRMRSVGRGQEFVIDVGDDSEAIAWVARVLGLRAEGLR
jgi:hypothetical protein|nr:hypothetical protein [Neorhizobium tomejilense]